jgi:alcohol dehydrogenase class IV
MLAKVAIVDPELTRDLPPRLTASTGLDALTQLIEPYVSAKANPLTDAFCVEGIWRAAANLPRVFANGHNAEARENMSLASLFGGLALANAGLGVVHGFAAPIGGQFEAPHGAVCAALLPYGIEVNLRALRERAPAHPSVTRYREIARMVTGDAKADGEHAATWVAGLCRRLEIPALRTYGIAAADVAGLVEKAAKASSMKANPIVLNDGELREILERAL